MNYKDIMADLKAGKYAPVYYLMGEESYYIDRIADYIADNALKPEERDFNQTILFGSDVTASAIVDAARRYPMMAERQVVIVKEAQNIRQTDALEKYMKQPLKSTILVICHKNGKVDGRKREYVKAIQAAGILFESPRLRDRDLPPFIMTLGTMTAVRGLALLISNGKPVTGVSEGYRAVAAGSIAGIPSLAIFLIVVIIICSFVATKTVYGRRVYACGGNIQAARVAGINTTLIRISTFAIAGLLAGLSGFLMTSRVTIGQPTAAESYEMDAITACVVGGVSMSGGVGKPWGVIIGTLLITVIANGLDILGVSSHWQKIVKGLIIVLAVLMDVKGKSRKD